MGEVIKEIAANVALKINEARNLDIDYKVVLSVARFQGQCIHENMAVMRETVINGFGTFKLNKNRIKRFEEASGKKIARFDDQPNNVDESGFFPEPESLIKRISR